MPFVTVRDLRMYYEIRGTVGAVRRGTPFFHPRPASIRANCGVSAGGARQLTLEQKERLIK